METEFGEIIGYSIIEDNSVKELRLPRKIIELLKSTEI